MAFESFGWDGSLDEAKWSRLAARMAKINNEHGVQSGLVATAAAGTRAVSVATGEGLLPGVLFNSDTAVPLTFDAQTGTTRVDLVVVRGVWATNTISIVVKKGSTLAPTPTQTYGDTWEMPLARVSVRAGATSIAAADIEGCRPLPRWSQTFRGSDIVASSVAGSNTTGKVISSVVVPDPGWPYVLEFALQMRVAGDSGYGLARVRNGTNDTTFASHYSGLLTTNNGFQPLTIVDSSGTLTGSTTVEFLITTDGMNAGSLSWGGGSNNRLTVRRVPAPI